MFNCTTGTCVLAGQNADGDSEESVTIANPAAGLWRVLVDGFAVPAGTTTYNYIDVFANPAFGSVAVTDANALRPAGASWTAPGTVTANAAPAAGRVLFGNVQVRTDTNVLFLAGSTSPRHRRGLDHVVVGAERRSGARRQDPGERRAVEDPPSACPPSPRGDGRGARPATGGPCRRARHGTSLRSRAAG